MTNVPIVPDVPVIPDFTVPRAEPPKPIRFKCNGDDYEAYPEVGGGLLLDTISFDDISQIANMPTSDAEAEQMDPARLAAMGRAASEQTRKLMHFLDTVLLPDSAAKFADAMRRAEQPITLSQAMTIARWLVGQYGARPTVPPSSSDNGHGGTGTDSTAGVPTEA